MPLMVENFAVGGQTAVEIVAIPGGEAGRLIARVVLRIIGRGRPLRKVAPTW